MRALATAFLAEDPKATARSASLGPAKATARSASYQPPPLPPPLPAVASSALFNALCQRIASNAEDCSPTHEQPVVGCEHLAWKQSGCA